MAIHAMKIAMLVAAFIVVVVFPMGKSEPNTDVKSLLCNDQSYGNGDPYDSSVQYVFASMVNGTPEQDGYNYYTQSLEETNIAYGHGTCTGNLQVSDCANCLFIARSTLISGCYCRIGAQVVLGDCTMRYENYPFS